MFPVVPSPAGRAASGSATDRPIDRVDRPDALEIETARRESSRNGHDDRPESERNEPAGESVIQLRSIDRTIGTLLDVVA